MQICFFSDDLCDEWKTNFVNISFEKKRNQMQMCMGKGKMPARSYGKLWSRAPPVQRVCPMGPQRMGRILLIVFHHSPCLTRALVVCRVCIPGVQVSTETRSICMVAQVSFFTSARSGDYCVYSGKWQGLWQEGWMLLGSPFPSRFQQPVLALSKLPSVRHIHIKKREP